MTRKLHRKDLISSHHFKPVSRWESDRENGRSEGECAGSGYANVCDERCADLNAASSEDSVDRC